MSISHMWQDAKDGVARKRGLRLNFSGHSEKLEMLSFTGRLDFLGVFHQLTDSKPNAGNRHIN